jgi:very-short-patch-repair endonuclease
LSLSDLVSKPAPQDQAAERLKELLGYVEQVIKLDERPAFRLSEFRLPTGQAFVFHQHELHALPGITHDLTDDDGPIWLKIQRVKRGEPPGPPEEVAGWLNLSPDPDISPALHEFRTLTVSESEKNELVSKGQARSEDCAAAMDPNTRGHFDVRLRLEDHPDVVIAAEDYISSAWLPWAEAERPKRKTIGIYQKLFEIVQLSELGGAEQPIEMVWGIGLTRWLKDGFEVDLPLLERLVEIELDESAGGDIRIRPRLALATANLRPYEELKIDGAPLALDAARRAIAAIDSDEGVSPFLRDAFEPALRACQARLDAQGRYLPDHEKLNPITAAPAAVPNLCVSDRWVIFVRRRSDNFLLNDISNLKKSIEVAEGDLPEPAKTLVMGPTLRTERQWGPLGTGIGGKISVDDGPTTESPLGDLFFPKQFNDEQVEIVHRLERSDGVVVQGPPGTGKTHTISNIICHYMATGRRVLVVSHGEPALAVLRQQLPEEVRDLAISITTSEREGFKQLESAVRLLQSIVESLRPSEQARLIEDIEQSIVTMRRRLAAIDAEIEKIAETQLSPVPGMQVKPAELAKSVARSREHFKWFVDRPRRFSTDLDFTDADIAALRTARVSLGVRIEHIEAMLPAINDLPDGARLAYLHENLVRAQQFTDIVAQDRSLTIRLNSAESVQFAEHAAKSLETLVGVRKMVEERPWLRKFAERAQAADQEHPVLVALRSFTTDASRLVEEHARYLQRPVKLPENFVQSAETIAIVTRLANAEQVFGVFAFRERSHRAAIEAIQILGRAPAGVSDWAHVRDHLSWRESVDAIHRRWDIIATEIGGPRGNLTSLKILTQLTNLLNAVLVSAPTAMRQLEQSLPRIAYGIDQPSSLWSNAERLASVHNVVCSALAAVRLSAAKADVERIGDLFTNASGRLGTLARDFIGTAVGRRDVDKAKIEHAWNAVRASIDDLAQFRTELAIVRRLSERIDAAGAHRWAYRVLHEPGQERDDSAIPYDWKEAWDWAVAESYLQSIDQRDRLQGLSEERVKLDQSISKTFERLVRERTFYALGSSMTGPVRAALMMFATALRKIGKGTGKGAVRHRKDARSAMSQCYDAIPCWIMPSWRVAEQLPGTLGSFDLVIMDEASQSDIKEVTALLRGKKVLVVGDDKQVSPSAAFIEDSKIERLARGYLKNQPFKTLLLPGASLYDLAKVMFPDKFVMLREHFRCVEPIIRFSMQFYPEPLVPLRVPTTEERIDPPLVDIYVSDGRRSRDKVNLREAEVIVEEVRQIISIPHLSRVDTLDRWRTIGVVSLIGAKQAATINRMLLDELGEEVMLRHRIACGDSATFQGNERDIVFLSMIADSDSKQAQTAGHFEQRFNVALSRARDRMVLVRSVREEELNPNDLKAKVIRHFRDPMAGVTAPAGDLMAMCDSDFEREILTRLLSRGYRVRPQVGALGYKIDLVVEGAGDRRLAIECDGDMYHGPERWADDMRRQRVLERVGWRFWRCWASSFTIDPDACMADLFATLDRLQVHPLGESDAANVYVEQRTVSPSAFLIEKVSQKGSTQDLDAYARSETAVEPPSGARPGDRIIIRYLDDNKTATFTLSTERNDPPNGLLSVASPLGKGLLGLVEEDEAEFEINGHRRRVLVVRTERQAIAAN